MGVSGPKTVSTWVATITGDESLASLLAGIQASRLPTESNSGVIPRSPSLAAIRSERSRSWNGGAGTRASSICSFSTDSDCRASQSRARVKESVWKGGFCSMGVGIETNFAEARRSVNAGAGLECPCS